MTYSWDEIDALVDTDPIRLRDVAWELQRALAAVEQDRDRYRQHSITLNAIAFATAETLGDVPPGADAIMGDPAEQAQRLIAEVTTQRQQQALLIRLIDDVPGTYPSQAHEVADEVRFILDKDGCRYCPPGCRSCLVDGDCECYDHQDAATERKSRGAARTFR